MGGIVPEGDVRVAIVVDVIGGPRASGRIAGGGVGIIARVVPRRWRRRPPPRRGGARMGEDPARLLLVRLASGVGAHYVRSLHRPLHAHRRRSGALVGVQGVARLDLSLGMQTSGGNGRDVSGVAGRFGGGGSE